MFNIIAACDDNNGIGKNGTIPWVGEEVAREDMREFRRKTIEGVVIMGRRTYESIGSPLANRCNIIVSRNLDYCKSTNLHTIIYTASSLENALAIAQEQIEQSVNAVNHKLNGKIWIIGGAELYAEALTHPKFHRAYISRIRGDYDCDVFMPPIAQPQIGLYNNGEIEVEVYGNGDEDNYLALMKRLLTAPVRPNRTGIPTRGLFAERIEFALTRGADCILPLLTTKKVPVRMVISELLWFLSGECTDTRKLHEEKCYIWDDNTTREFLDSRGLTEYTPGECGPIYGYQWRSWNRPYLPAKYKKHRKSSIDASDRRSNETTGNDTNGCIYTVSNYSVAKEDDSRQGIDQLARVINTLRTDPFDRRMIVSAWNPEQLCQMALPPCHWSFQFHCEINTDSAHPQKYVLNCLLNMRSADFALGVPFNIASYALLTHMVAHCVGARPGKLVILMADCHLYTNHMDGAREQIERAPGQFPTVRFTGVTAGGSIDQFKSVEQIIVEGYSPHGPIKYPMAV